MRQRDKIIEILGSGNQLTQAQIAEKIYGDRNHLTHVYSALQDLVTAGMVCRLGNHPALYSLTEKQTSRPDPVETTAQSHLIDDERILTSSEIDSIVERVMDVLEGTADGTITTSAALLGQTGHSEFDIGFYSMFDYHKAFFKAAKERGIRLVRIRKNPGEPEGTPWNVEDFVVRNGIGNASSREGRNHRDVSGDVISNESLQETETIVQKDEAYGKEFDLITGCLQRFPTNTDPYVVAMKIGVIDITNSTHLAQHKSKISMDELCRIITAIPDIDRRIAEGDPTVVNEIAKSNGEINLFSFASKYCCYHNYNLYHRDDYSILDTVLKETLPLYFPEITKGQIQRWQDHFQYEMYNGFITRKLDDLGITIEGRKRKFDHFVWYKNRGQK